MQYREIKSIGHGSRAVYSQLTVERRLTGKREEVRLIIGADIREALNLKPGEKMLVTVNKGGSITLKKSRAKAAYTLSSLSKTSRALQIRVTSKKLDVPVNKCGEWSCFISSKTILRCMW